MLGAKETAQKAYSKVPAQSEFQAILCEVEEMPTQTDGRFCLIISSTAHKMAWYRLGNTLFV